MRRRPTHRRGRTAEAEDVHHAGRSLAWHVQDEALHLEATHLKLEGIPHVKNPPHDRLLLLAHVVAGCAVLVAATLFAPVSSAEVLIVGDPKATPLHNLLEQPSAAHAPRLCIIICLFIKGFLT